MWPKWRVVFKSVRHVKRRVCNTFNLPLPHIVWFTFGFTSGILLLTLFRASALSSSRLEKGEARKQSNGPPRLFIAIGSAPNHTRLRAAIRATWLSWLPKDGSITYRFFSDAPPHRLSSHLMWRQLRDETRDKKDIELQPIPSGYGDNEHNQYGRRALYQLHWAVTYEKEHDFFLRIDDDSFLCLHRLAYEIRNVPRSQFFWGRFWCRAGRNRADENFMFFTRDIVDLFTSRFVSTLLPFDTQVSLGWNFGFWSWLLNLTIFDDQLRIDAQQAYLTDYMHDEHVHVRAFCERFLFAHHVSANTMESVFAISKTHLMYSLPRHTSPNETCAMNTQTFLPSRHSINLPSIRLERLSQTRQHKV